MQTDNKDKVQTYVDKSCNGQEQKRADGIADSTQDGTCKVIKKHNRHAGKLNTHVEGGKVDNVCRSIHQCQQRLCQNDADDAEKKSTDNRKRNCRMYGVFDFTFLIGSVVTGNQYIDAYGKSHKDVNQEIDQGAGGAYGCEGLLACKFADYNHVGCVEQEL